MNATKIKTYVLTISQTFPTTHPRKGEPTTFFKQFWDGDKIHTIRGNYELWEKRIEEIKNGKAVLSIRKWTGKPYNSPQKEECRMDSRSRIGVQKIEFDDYLYSALIDGNRFGDIHKLAKNDGLAFADFEAWFKGADISKPFVIIHFTNFRY